MGSCCSMIEGKNKIILPLAPPKLPYLCLKTGRLYQIESGKFSKLKLPKLKIHKSCAIGYLSGNNIMIAGGIRINNRLSSDVFLINTSTLSVVEYPSLSKPSKNGSIHHIGFFIYYISSDLTEPHQKLVSNKWELMQPNPIDLHSSSVMVQDNIIYFICGLKPNGKPTKKLYCLDLTQKCEYILTKHKINFKLYNPVSFSAYDFVIVAGGFKLDRKPNLNFFIQRNWEWVEIVGQEIELEQYPCLYANRTCFFVGKLKKVISIDWSLKISVFTDHSLPRQRAKTHQPIARKRKYRKNSIFLQETLNNYTLPFQNLPGSVDALCSIGDSSESESEISLVPRSSRTNYSPNLSSPSPRFKSDASMSSFQLSLNKITSIN